MSRKTNLEQLSKSQRQRRGREKQSKIDKEKAARDARQ